MITIPGRAVPKERMTHKQVKCAIGGMEGKKFDRIRNCLNYQEYIAYHVMKLKKYSGLLRLTARIFLSPNKKGQIPGNRGDLDNYIKTIKDGLQYGKLFDNDKQIILYGEGTGIYTDTNERVEIEIQEIREG